VAVAVGPSRAGILWISATHADNLGGQGNLVRKVIEFSNDAGNQENENPMSGDDAKSKGQTSGFQRQREGRRSEGYSVITTRRNHCRWPYAGLDANCQADRRVRHRSAGNRTCLDSEVESGRIPGLLNDSWPITCRHRPMRSLLLVCYWTRRGQTSLRTQALLTEANAYWVNSHLGMFPSHILFVNCVNNP